MDTVKSQFVLEISVLEISVTYLEVEEKGGRKKRKTTISLSCKKEQDELPSRKYYADLFDS